MVCSGAIFNYVTMADSGVINSGHEPNSVQSLLQCPFERRTLAEKLKVKELGPDQPDDLIYCQELFEKLFAVPLCHSPTSTNFHQPPLLYGLHRKCYQNYNALQLHYLLMVFGIDNLEGKLVVCRKKKDIVRHITDCKLCVVLRKHCTNPPKKMHYSQLVILFRFTKQNK